MTTTKVKPLPPLPSNDSLDMTTTLTEDGDQPQLSGPNPQYPSQTSSLTPNRGPTQSCPTMAQSPPEVSRIRETLRRTRARLAHVRLPRLTLPPVRPILTRMRQVLRMERPRPRPLHPPPPGLWLGPPERPCTIPSLASHDPPPETRIAPSLNASPPQSPRTQSIRSPNVTNSFPQSPRPLSVRLRTPWIQQSLWSPRHSMIGLRNTEAPSAAIAPQIPNHGMMPAERPPRPPTPILTMREDSPAPTSLYETPCSRATMSRSATPSPS